ncbi:MAG: PaaI family thioesterase [Porticoccaceae bacterium]
MKGKSHIESLVSMHDAANINKFYNPKLRLSEGTAEIEVDVVEKFFHAGGAVHGSVYFKMLDDAAWYAANSLEHEFFLVTTSFTTYITRPVSSGVVRAVGRVLNRNKSQFISEAVIYDDKGSELGRGNGIFVKSKIPLVNADGYQ